MTYEREHNGMLVRSVCSGCGEPSPYRSDQGLGRATLAAWESRHACSPGARGVVAQ